MKMLAVGGTLNTMPELGDLVRYSDGPNGSVIEAYYSAKNSIPWIIVAAGYVSPGTHAGVWYGCYDDEQADAAYTMCSDRYLTDRSSQEV